MFCLWYYLELCIYYTVINIFYCVMFCLGLQIIFFSIGLVLRRFCQSPTNINRCINQDTEREELKVELAALEGLGDKITESDAIAMTKLQERWMEIEGDAAPHIASIILTGKYFYVCLVLF